MSDHLQREIEKVRKRRADRELEKAQMEEEQAMLARERAYAENLEAVGKEEEVCTAAHWLWTAIKLASSCSADWRRPNSDMEFVLGWRQAQVGPSSCTSGSWPMLCTVMSLCQAACAAHDSPTSHP